jgi:hypothetical protein
VGVLLKSKSLPCWAHQADNLGLSFRASTYPAGNGVIFECMSGWLISLQSCGDGRVEVVVRAGNRLDIETVDGGLQHYCKISCGHAGGTKLCSVQVMTERLLVACANPSITSYIRATTPNFVCDGTRMAI